MIIRKIPMLLVSTGLIFGFAAFNCSNSGDYESDSESDNDNEDDDNDSSGSTGTACVVTTTGTGNALFYVLSPAHTAASSHGGSDHATGGSQAYTNCASCHGTNLEGTINYTLPAANSSTGIDEPNLNPPCCTTCHGVKW